MLENPRITGSAAQPAAVIHLTIPREEIQEVMGPGIGELMETLAAQGIAPAGPIFSHHLRMDPKLLDFELGAASGSEHDVCGRLRPIPWRTSYHCDRRLGEMSESFGVMVRTDAGPGILHRLTGVIAHWRGDISSVDIISQGADEARLYFEIEMGDDPASLIEDLRALPIVREVARVKTLQMIYGKRIIIMGGGAQVGQVAVGAVAEADRHNIRGERISVDTIPLVGEQPLADAVRAVARLPRASALVLAGALMGGDIERAVREVREQGLLVVSLNMAGSVPDAADLVVTDPVQAGVMTVMAISNTAKFSVDKLKRRVF